MEIGKKYTESFSFTQENVNDFALITGDTNPIHLDEELASKSIFGRRIVHGFLAGSVFSKIFGVYWPGEGTIYLKQDLTFRRPVFTGQSYSAILTVVELLPKNKALIETLLLEDGTDEVVIEGKALIKYS